MRERGSIFPLIAGLLALALAAVIAVSSVGTLTLERHRLMALAEATALRASESFDPSQLRREGQGVKAPLTSSAIHTAARNFISSTPHRFDSLRLVSADSPDGERARVVLETTWRAPLLSEWLPAEVTVRAEAWARSIIQ
jgi:hypothetical protein